MAGFEVLLFASLKANYHNAETRQMRRILAEKRNIKGVGEKVPNSG